MRQLQNLHIAILMILLLIIGGVGESFAQSGPVIRGKVYGGGQNARVLGKELKSDATDITVEANWQEQSGADATTTTVILNHGEVFGNIYGGGALADVEGNATVNIADVKDEEGKIVKSGKFAGNVFGGGEGDDSGATVKSADVKGNTRVNITGGEIIWDRAWVDGEEIRWSDDRKLTGATFSHNIYAGGNIASKIGTWKNDGSALADGKENTGTAVIRMMRGLIGDDLIMNTPEWKTAFTNEVIPHFAVFGGGYGIYTKSAKSDVFVALPQAGSQGSIDGDEQLARPQRANGRMGEETESLPIVNRHFGMAWATVHSIFGGGYNGYVGSTNVTVDDSTYVHRIYGGGLGSYEGFVQADKPATFDDQSDEKGYCGVVNGNTNVTVYGAHVYGDVFGGGAGVEPGKEIEVDVVKSLDRNVSSTEFTDFHEVARVNGSTKVNIAKDAAVYGSVYGGGDVANVTHGTAVDLNGGNVFGYVVGAGLGRQKDQAYDYTTIGRVGTTGADDKATVILHRGKKKAFIIDGSSELPVEGDDGFVAYSEMSDDDGDAATPFDDNTEPWVWQDIFGGGRNGLTFGSTKVTIGGGLDGGFELDGNGAFKQNLDGTFSTTERTPFNGHFGGNVYGGGWGNAENGTSADVKGSSMVVVNGGNVIWNQMANEQGDIKTWKKEDYTKEVTLEEDFEPDTEFYDAEAKRFTRDHNIFGGGYLACEVAGNTTVLVNKGHVNDENLFTFKDAVRNLNDEIVTPVKYSVASRCWRNTLDEQRDPQFSIFGAGYGLKTKTGGDAAARFEVLAVWYKQNDGTYKATKDSAWVGAPQTKDHYTAGWTPEYEQSLAWTEADNAGTTEKAKLANFTNISQYKRPNYVAAERRLRTSVFANTLGKAGNTVMQVVGGGFNGCVSGNSKASAHSRSIVGKMFGGGYGSLEAWQEAKGIEKAERLPAGTWADRVGTVGGTATLDIDRGALVKRDAFGGGAGVESVKFDASGEVLTPDDKGYAEAEFTDFPDVAKVGNTKMELGKVGASRAWDFVIPVVYGSVYGGGDVANVEGDTDCDLYRIEVMQYFFGGGNGRLNKDCRDYTSIGSVNNTRVDMHFEQDKDSEGHSIPFTKTYGSVTQEYNHEPRIWNRAYGGGRNGVVRGNTNVTIDGGQFGANLFGGGWGDVPADDDPAWADVPQEKRITSADVYGNTHMTINGGEEIIDHMWEADACRWTPRKIYNGQPYSPQYLPDETKFYFNHNVYGGGNAACKVGTLDDDNLKDGTGHTYLTVTKGMMTEQYYEELGTPFLESWEWRDIYVKLGTLQFSMFGAGYGKNTYVLGDTHVNVNIKGRVEANDDAMSVADHTTANNSWCEHGEGKEMGHDHLEANYLKCPEGQTIMNVVGGGYDGTVIGTSNVNVKGNSYIRTVYGGGCYSPVGNSVVNIESGNIDYVFGGGMMGDVLKDVTVNIGTELNDNDDDDDNDDPATVGKRNAKLVILKNVFGANDVAGYVGAQEAADGSIVPTEGSRGVDMNLCGGTIYGNVYGSGNGNYLYKLSGDVERPVPHENYDIKGEKRLIFEVPVRASSFPSFASMSDAQKLVNIASYRPQAMKVDIDFKGNSLSDRLVIKGSLFGGGNSATVVDYDGEGGDDASVKINVGSHIDVGSVFIGSDGEELFNTSNKFMENFQTLNGTDGNDIQLMEDIDWEQPENKDIPEIFLRVPKEKRAGIYKFLLDLYFTPVEMNLMPEVTWNGRNNSVGVADGTVAYRDVPDTEAGLTDAVIGTFCCGGNRGNMNTATKFNVNFPAGLTITDKIVGGCNNANYTYQIPGTLDPSTGKYETREHVGGYLLGTHGVGANHDPQITLTLRNKFCTTLQADETYAESINVFGGCYTSGTVRGDIKVDVRTNMLKSIQGSMGHLEGLDPKKLRQASDEGRTVAGVYGAGYGKASWVYGDTEVVLGYDTETHTGYPNNISDYNSVQGAACNFIFGGGRQGNVVGNTNVRVYGGRVAGCVVGASYAGYLYGNAQTMIGYPEKYYRCNVSGKYDLTRTDNYDHHDGFVDAAGRKVIKKSIWHTRGDLVSDATYKQLSDADKLKFSVEHSVPAGNNWANVDILIDRAVYGGGYAVQGDATVGVGSYTVRKYTDDFQFTKDILTDPLVYGFQDNDAELAKIKDYGGNTFVMIGDVSENYDDMADIENYRENGASVSPIAHPEADHIQISSSSLEEVNVSIGSDLFGLYCRRWIDDGSGSGHYEATVTSINYQTLKQPGDQNKYYRFTGEGGVYGDGFLSLSEGFRVSDIVGYGYHGSAPNSTQESEQTKLMNCIHRFDIARFKDCCMSLLGDLDYASDRNDITTASKYSISRVGELQMESAINRNADFSSVDHKRSRNYVALCNKVNDLGAVWSDDRFVVEKNGDQSALYHDASGKLGLQNSEVRELVDQINTTGDEDAGITYKKVKEWFVGYKGDELKNSTEKIEGTDKTLPAITDDLNSNSGIYDNPNAKVLKEDKFQLRNSATAANMFGIASGLALYIKGNHFDKGSNAAYYGPAKGVFEVLLVNVRPGEAGGYVYAMNRHDDKLVNFDHNGQTQEDKPTFLETTGNFVFPATVGRKVIDNCYPDKFVFATRDAAEGHYWYVSGFKYFYDGLITGYTYDNKYRDFHMENSSHLIFMPGAKAGSPLTLEQFHFLDRHIEGQQENCDIERLFLTKQVTEVPDGSSSASVAEEWAAITALGKDQTTYGQKQYYNLSVSASQYDRYAEQTSDAEPKVIPHVEFLKEDIKEKKTTTINGVTEEYYEYAPQQIDMGELTDAEPYIAVKLLDLVKNNKPDGDVEYYDEHLFDPCVAFLQFLTPAVDGQGVALYDSYEPIDYQNSESIETVFGSKFPDVATTGNYAEYYNNQNKESAESFYFYLQDQNGDYYAALTWAEVLAAQEATIGVFYPPSEDKYIPLAEDAQYDASLEYYIKNGSGEYVKQTGLTKETYDSTKGSTNYYYLRPAATRQNYEYNLTLTIQYVKGPDYVGYIDIKNCALPGEMIRISTEETLKITSSEFLLPFDKGYWAFGESEKAWNDPEDPSKGFHLVLKYQMEDDVMESDRTDATGRRYMKPVAEPKNLYYPYNPFVTDPDYQKTQGTGVLGGKVGINENNGDIYVPAYYFMDGNTAQYSFTVSGLEDNEVFDVEANDRDSLVIHNYHSMRNANYPTLQIGDTEVRRAAVNALTQTGVDGEGKPVYNYNRRPRVYIGANDLAEFKTYVERTTNVPVTGAGQRVATDYGAGTDFFLLEDVTVPRNWTPISNFKGTLHGNGHVINGLGEQALFASVESEAKVYNLGLLQGKITDTDDAVSDKANYSCCYTFNSGVKDSEGNTVHTVYRMDGSAVTSYTEDEWRTGRVAYDLNEFYLRERMDRQPDVHGVKAHDDTYDGNGYVEKIYNDGEYRFMHYRTKDETKNEFLRSSENPHYAFGTVKDIIDAPSTISNHFYTYAAGHLSHDIDLPRSIYNNDEQQVEYYTTVDEYNAGHALTKAEFAALTPTEKIKIPAVLYTDYEEYNAINHTDLTQAEYDLLADNLKIKTPAVLFKNTQEYNDAHAITASDFAALTEEQKIKTPYSPRTVREFHPLFDEIKHDTEKNGDVDKIQVPSVVKNDYLFFGQTINEQSYSKTLPTLGQNVPQYINGSTYRMTTTHNVSAQTNRVWRAYGFYHSKKDDAYHFNKEAWVMHPGLTAIDFTGAHDAAPKHGWVAGLVPSSASAESEPIFYPMVMDIPVSATELNTVASLTDFNITTQNKVTKNLVVYTEPKAVAPATDVTATEVDKVLNYDQSDEESSILGHQVFATATPGTYQTPLFHLVERPASVTGYSNDFNAPIEFNVTQRAWYERKPLLYRTVDYVGSTEETTYGNLSAWDGICLPFTAKRVFASTDGVMSNETNGYGHGNGEITHFYGAVAKDVDPALNDCTLHHEYWLTGMVAAEDDKATFARPSVSNYATGEDVEPLFYAPGTKYGDADVNNEAANYTFKNDFFLQLDGHDGNANCYDEEKNPWYAASHDFENYTYLTGSIPYVVSFPGRDFYEFDLSGEWYKKVHNPKHPGQSYSDEPQTITYEAVSADAGTPAATIRVSDDETKTTSVNEGKHKHVGTYMAYGAGGDYMGALGGYGMNAGGTAFDDDVKSVVPFRTYMNVESAGGARPKVVYIVDDDKSIVDIEESHEPEDELVPGSRGLSIRINKLVVTVTSTYEEMVNINVYNTNGQLLRVHCAQPGVSTFTLSHPGVYIIGKRKFVVKK